MKDKKRLENLGVISTKDLWLSNAEKKQFLQENSLLREYIEELKEVDREGSGVARNKDGQFSKRSKLGTELRSRENSIKSTINLINHKIDTLSYKPKKQHDRIFYAIQSYHNKKKKIFPQYIAILCGLITWCLTDIIQFAMVMDSPVEEEVEAAIIIALMIAAISSCIIYLIILFSTKLFIGIRVKYEFLNTIDEPPPYVTVMNINDY